MVNPSTHPEQFDLCRNCGQTYCGRLIEKVDGSIWPANDTGYRYQALPVKAKVELLRLKHKKPLPFYRNTYLPI